MLRIEDVMKRLNVSRQTVYRIMNSGELPYYKILRSTRFREEDLVRYIETIKHGGKTLQE